MGIDYQRKYMSLIKVRNTTKEENDAEGGIGDQTLSAKMKTHKAGTVTLENVYRNRLDWNVLNCETSP